MGKPNEKSDGLVHSVANGAQQHSKLSARMSEKASVGGFQWTGQDQMYCSGSSRLTSVQMY